MGGADVTVFNRGTHAAPAGVTALRGDRSVVGLSPDVEARVLAAHT